MVFRICILVSARIPSLVHDVLIKTMKTMKTFYYINDRLLFVNKTPVGVTDRPKHNDTKGPHVRLGQMFP